MLAGRSVAEEQFEGERCLADQHLQPVDRIQIARGKDFQSLNVERLFPAGEGAGYAGGILSAAIDGIKIAEAVAASISTNK